MKTPRRRAFPLVAVFKALWQSLWQAYARAVLFLSSRGVDLPGRSAARKTVAPQTISAYERRTLVYELKASRYQYAHGPLWLRALVDSLSSAWQKNRFWVALLAKGTFGALFLALPLALFLLLRGGLPVPERVPERPPTLALSPRTSLRVERPYVLEEGATERNLKLLALRDGENVLRGLPVRELQGAGGAVLVSLGALPRRLEEHRGFLVSESSDLALVATKTTRVAVEGSNRLRARWFAFPSASREPVSCRLEIVGEGGGEPLASSDFSPAPPPGVIASRLASLFLSRFTPDYALDPVVQGEIFVDTDALPGKLIARVVRTGGFGSPPVLANESSSDAVSEDCLAFLGEPAFEWQNVSSSPRRGALLVVVEGLRPEDVESPVDAPFLASLTSRGTFHFSRHRMSTDNPSSNTLALLTASPWLQGASKETSLPKTLRQAGFRLAAFGTLPSAGHILDDFDTQVRLEAREYESRHVTEEASAWLERYGEAPFLGLLQYSSLLPPFRPPFSNLPLFELFKGPFGFARERALRKGLLRSLDAELAILASRLKALGVWKGSDVIVTSNGSLPFSMEPFGDVKGFPPEFRGAPRLRESGLFEDALRAPLVWKPAETDDRPLSVGGGVLKTSPLSDDEGPFARAGHRVDRPSFQADIGRTLLSLFSPSSLADERVKSDAGKGNNSHTVDFAEALVSGSLLDLNTLLSDRRVMPLSGVREIGALVFSEKGFERATKIVEVFRPATLEFMKDAAPYFERRRIPTGERFTVVTDTPGGGERPLRQERSAPLGGSTLVGGLRNTLTDVHFPRGRPLRLTFQPPNPSGTGTPDTQGATTLLPDKGLVFHFARRESVHLLEVPPELLVSWETSSQAGVSLHLRGAVRTAERLRIAFPSAELFNVEGLLGNAFLVCQGALRVWGDALSALVRARHPCLRSHDDLPKVGVRDGSRLLVEVSFESAPSFWSSDARLANEPLGH